LTTLLYSKRLRPETVNALTTRPQQAEVFNQTASSARTVRIKRIEEPNHPANGQRGLYASQHLPAGSLIIFYLGYVHDEAETDPTSDYDLSLDRELGIAVDATRHGNEARFINDYRGVAEAPNAEFRDVWASMAGNKYEKRMAVFVMGAGKSGKKAKGIAKGEEIVVSYGKGFWSERKD
jgi:hypothetical protein